MRLLLLIFLTLGFLFFLRETSALAVRVFVEPFLASELPTERGASRDVIAYVVFLDLGLALLLHPLYVIIALVGEARWRRRAGALEEALLSGDQERANAACRGSSEVQRALEASREGAPAGLGRSALWLALFLTLFLLPLLLDVLGSAFAWGQAPTLNYHGSALLVCSLLAIPTAISCGLALSLGPRRRARAFGLSLQLEAARAEGRG